MLDAQINPSPLVAPAFSLPAPTPTLELAPTAFPDGTGPLITVGELPLPPTLGEYRVLARLARGGMCGVYLGEHRSTGERVALKVLDGRWWPHQDIVERTLGEREVSRRAPHGGLVRILDAAVDDGVPYLVMELIDGESLGTLIERGPMELGAVAAIGAQVADAVAALHDAGVIHCDLKPDNVMVLYREGLAGWPRIKVLDFGVARFGKLSQATEVAGTPCYMSPEQWRGLAEPRSDVYGLGCLLYELLTGSAPFEGKLSKMMHDHCNTLAVPPSRLATVPAALDRLVMRMLAKDPGMRARMSDVARALADLAYALPPGACTLPARAVNQ